MMIEFLSHLLSFDFSWIISLVMDNLIIVFGMLALAYFWSDSKKTTKWIALFLISVFAVYSAQDFSKAAGLIYLTGGFLMFDYVVRMVVGLLSEAIPQLKDKMIIVQVARFYAVIILFNFLIGVF